MLPDNLCSGKKNSITKIDSLINVLSLIHSRLVSAGRVRTMASASHCTRKTAMCAFARTDSQEKIAKKV